LSLSLFVSVGKAQTSDAGWEGPYSPIPFHVPADPNAHCCEIAHAILLGKEGRLQGKVLLIQSNGERWLWDPASPNSVSTEISCDLDVFDEDVHNLFCAGHGADSNGDIVVHGGTRYRYSGASPTYCMPQPRYSFVFTPDEECWVPEYPMLVPTWTPAPPNFQNLGYWYPGSVRLPDGRVMSVGGGSDPVTTNSIPNVCHDVGANYFVNGWQILDRSQGGWIGGNPAQSAWFTGLPGSYMPAPWLTVNFEFNYYPLVSSTPGGSGSAAPGYIFAAVATDNRGGNYWNVPGFPPHRSASGVMPIDASFPTNGAWTVHPSQICKPGTTIPRNLYYPNGFLWPMQLNAQGTLAAGSPRRFVVMAGCDQNDYLTGTLANPTTLQSYEGGRQASGDVYSIDNPESPGSAWTTGTLPALTLPRMYGSVVLLPNETVFAVGGAHYDFLPFAGQGNTNAYMRERRADPIFFPEMIDLTSLGNGNPWVVCQPHISPRLYHASAILLPDARVMVSGGYRGKIKTSPSAVPMTPEEWTWHNFVNQHSDIEIYSPDYLSAGARPQILNITGGGSSISYGNNFEIKVALPGAASPAQDIGSVCLISPASATHHYDWDQRFLKLSYSQSPGFTNRLTIMPPANSNIAQPGWYMLFINTSASASTGGRIPSIAKFVKLQ
jgi:hypothetical protein